MTPAEFIILFPILYPSEHGSEGDWRRYIDCDEFVAGDNSLLRELLHPSKANLAIRYSLAHAVVKPGQYILNTGSSELKFLCIVDPAWQREDEEIL